MAGLALSSTALASDAYPAKPVKIIVGFQAGGPTDVVARLVAKALQDELKGLSSWKTRWVRPATSPRKWWLPPGRWLHLAAGGRTVDDEQIRVPQAEVRSAQELRAGLQSLRRQVLAASPKLNVKTYKEFMSWPGKTGIELWHHGCGWLAAHGDAAAGATDGGPDAARAVFRWIGCAERPDCWRSRCRFYDIHRCHAQPGSGQSTASRGGRPNRLPGLPQVPTFSEVGLPGHGVRLVERSAGACGTPKAIVDKLSAAVMKAVKSKEFKEVLIPQGAVLIGNSPSEFKAQLQTEVGHWSEQFKKFKIEK
jgi:hypothetical protein